ncbi:hypothetical protein EV361DRAFT_966344 [Lentinula raphanica]|nr:hypothetical protein EV361DRAFT_966344 [Lentinula raphanica]
MSTNLTSPCLDQGNLGLKGCHLGMEMLSLRPYSPMANHRTITLSGNTVCIHPRPGSTVNIIVYPTFPGPLQFTFDFPENGGYVHDWRRAVSVEGSVVPDSEPARCEEAVNNSNLPDVRPMSPSSGVGSASSYPYPPEVLEFFDMLDHGSNDRASQTEFKTEDEDGNPFSSPHLSCINMAEHQPHDCASQTESETEDEDGNPFSSPFLSGIKDSNASLPTTLLAADTDASPMKEDEYSGVEGDTQMLMTYSQFRFG